MFFSSRSRYQVLLLTLLAGYLFWGIPTALQAQRLFTVVIDAGHGGKDPGTVGNGGKEKDITLSVAKIVGRKIKANHPEVRVLYTRETDTFVGLQARADYANRHKASLMLSIHVNSAPTATVNGTETYVLGVSKFANNLSVAMRENKAMLLESDYKTTYRGFDPTSTESYIMFDLMQDAYITKKHRLRQPPTASLPHSRMLQPWGQAGHPLGTEPVGHAECADRDWLPHEQARGEPYAQLCGTGEDRRCDLRGLHGLLHGLHGKERKGHAQAGRCHRACGHYHDQPGGR